VTFVPVGPAPVVRFVMRPMTKALNPLIGRFAGRRGFGMAARLHHVGRRSGRPYVTSVGARLAGDAVLIPLTFGNQSDWARNVRAAGHCTIRLDGVDHETVDPEFLPISAVRSQLRSTFSPVERFSFRLLGIKQVLRLRLAANS